MVDLHRSVRANLGRVHSCLVSDWLVKQLSLCLINIAVGTTVHDIEVALPALRKLIVLFSRWKGTGLAFFERHASLGHHFLHILVGFARQALEFLHFAVLFSANIGDSW